MTYEQVIERKARRLEPCGITPGPINQLLFDWQRRTVDRACRIGRSAVFAECGLGKTPMQLEWSRQVTEQTNRPGLILAPLAVGKQTQREAEKFGIEARYARDRAEMQTALTAGVKTIITNYERLEKFNPDDFRSVVLDESSILKAMTGKTRRRLTEFSASIPYRLCCTATPAPNDHMELGNHAEFLGVMTAAEMLATFFVHDGGDTSKWRLKGHAQAEFWRWVCSWATAISKPSDIGGSDDGFVLPSLEIYQVTVDSESDGQHLFPMEAKTLGERRDARKSSINERVAACAEIVESQPKEQWLLWCNLNAESEALARECAAMEVRGSMSVDAKEEALLAFSAGEIDRLVTKPSIAGFGMNWQQCARNAVVGLSDSWEQYYQLIRRTWRFGQSRPVQCYVVTAETEGAVVRNIERKDRQAMEQREGMMAAMQEGQELSVSRPEKLESPVETKRGENWTITLSDAVLGLSVEPDESINYSIFSPPFASLYTYTDSPNDMGNCRNHDEFFAQFRFLVAELFRTTKPGRLCSFHCMDLPMSKMRDGEIALRDFRGLLIREFENAGWLYHSGVTIWKDPVTAMQRTKALGLLWKQLKKDSSMSRQGIADYLITMRKPGVNAEPISHTAEEFPVAEWQKIASPVWMDINPSDTLQYRSAREDKDERHICPLQLQVIRRALMLWSNPGDLVLSPFTGIGSEGYEAIKADRRFIGFELKQSYFDQAVRNLTHAEKYERKQQTLFSAEETEHEAVVEEAAVEDAA